MHHYSKYSREGLQLHLLVLQVRTPRTEDGLFLRKAIEMGNY